MARSGIILMLFVLFSGFLNPSDKPNLKKDLSPPYLCCETPWADSVFTSLNSEERIAQLFMVAAYSNKGPDHVAMTASLIEKYKVGGLIFFQGGPVRQARLNNQYQRLSKVPLMIAIDGEWGLGMRLDSTMKFPYQMALGAIQDNHLIYEMGTEVARQFKEMGIHVNFAPVVDVNNNPKNPVINYRSFGEVRENVALKGIAYMQGMQDNGILANAKHFPGHGDTDKDSHVSLPVILHDRKRLDSLELYPFQELIRKGLGSVMIAHLYIPALESEKNTATTLSHNTVTTVLKEEMGFNGLIFTDALSMQGVSDYNKPGILDTKALLAGNDILLLPADVPKAIEEIQKAIKKGKISQEEIDLRCHKVLKAKEWMQLNVFQDVKTIGLTQRLNTNKAQVLKRELIAGSLTLPINKSNIIPLKSLDTLRVASLAIGNSSSSNTHFQNMLNNYMEVKHFSLPAKPTLEQITETMFALKKYNLVIASIHSQTNSPSKNFGISSQCAEMINNLTAKNKTLLTVFANPYGLNRIKSLMNTEALLVAYANKQDEQELAAQLLFGGIPASGKLPVSISKELPAGSGLTTTGPIRLNYSLPENVGIQSSALDTIDSIAHDIIKNKYTPGCQVFIAKEGTVVYNKSFGYHTYDEKIRVKNQDLYDLASITKILSTTSTLIKLEKENRIHLDSTLGYYYPGIDTSEYKDITLRQILAHHGRLKSWIPFWLKTVDGVTYSPGRKKMEGKAIHKPGIYNGEQTTDYPIRVAGGLYTTPSYSDSIMEQILQTPLREKNEYFYSDLGYYFLKPIIEEITGQPLEQYADKHFYAPLGVPTLGYLPRNRFDLDRIVPTENDQVFREQLIHGDVHDPGAALLGGVGGHAGLFASANDVGVFMQMLLQNGKYGGTQFLDSSILKQHTQCQFCGEENRRGAGFDRPEMDYTKDGPTCQCISGDSFGHTGFTGTMAWADPEENIVYVFLSNRIHPDASNRKLIKHNIRTRIQEAIYRSINKEGS